MLDPHTEANIENLYFDDVDPILPKPSKKILRANLGKDRYLTVQYGKTTVCFQVGDCADHIVEIFEQLACQA